MSILGDISFTFALSLDRLTKANIKNNQSTVSTGNEFLRWVGPRVIGDDSNQGARGSSFFFLLLTVPIKLNNEGVATWRTKNKTSKKFFFFRNKAR